MQPSPESQELIKMIDTEVNLSSGKLNVSLPIYTLSTDGVSVPISINYNSGGVKVDDVSTNVGLGWNLNAGGRITRTVRGNRPDEFPGLGFIDFQDNIPHPFLGGETVQGLTDFVNNVLTPVNSSLADTEPDMFYFSVPGASGKFILMPGGATKQLVKTNVRISWSLSGGILGFDLVTENGRIHVFGEGNEDYTEQHNVSAGGLSHDDLSCQPGIGAEEPEPAVTTWHISRIYQGLGADETVQFHYLQDHVEYQASYTERIKSKERGTEPSAIYTCGIDNRERTSGCITRVEHDVHYIDHIDSKNYVVRFQYNNLRTDMDIGGKRLDKIQVYHKKGDGTEYLMNEYDFIMGMWTSTGSPIGTTATAATKKRMYLDKIRIKNKSGGVLPDYDFSYSNGQMLPPRLSFDQDYWGYYNAAGNSTFVPFLGTDEQGSIEFLEFLTRHPSANRNANETVSDFGTLVSYKNPYGGITGFEYENHEVGTGFETAGLCFYEVKNKSHSSTYNGSPTQGTATFDIPFEQEVKVTVSIYQAAFCDLGGNGANAVLENNLELPISTVVDESYCAPHTTEMPHLTEREVILTLPAGPFQIRTMANNPGEHATIKVKYLSRTDNEGLIGGLRVRSKTDNDVRIYYSYKEKNDKKSGVLMTFPKFRYGTKRKCAAAGFNPPAGNQNGGVTYPLPFGFADCNYFFVENTVVESNQTGSNGHWIMECIKDSGASDAPNSLPVANGEYERTLFSSSSQRNLSNNNGNHVEYKRVVEDFDKNGKVGHHFHILRDEPVGLIKSNYETAHAPKGDNGWQSGTLKKKEYFREGDDINPRRKEIYEYDYLYGHADEILGLTMKKEYTQYVYSATSVYEQMTDRINQYSIEYYPIRTDAALLLKVTNIDYDLGNNPLPREVSNEYDDKGRISRTVTQGSVEMEYISQFKYADDYVSEVHESGSPVIVDGVYYGSDAFDEKVEVLRELVKRNFHSPIEQLNYIRKGNGSAELLGGTFIEYGKEPGQQYLPVRTHSMEFDSPQNIIPSATSFVDADGELRFVTGYMPQGSIDGYNYLGNPLQYTTTHHNPSSYIWDEKGMHLLAKVENAPRNQVAYTSFEIPDEGDHSNNGRWAISSATPSGPIASAWTDTESKTGMYSLNLHPDDEIKALGLNTEYLLSFWYMGSGADISLEGTVLATAPQSSGWNYYELVLDAPTNNLPPGDDDVILGSIIISSQTGVKIDELRLHPTDALMETYCYHPDTRKMITTNNINNRASHFEYDGFHRLKYVRDQDRNILVNYEYDIPNNNYEKNSVRVRTALVPGLKVTGTFADDFDNLQKHEKSETIRYSDGFMKPLQGIALGQSPLGGDIVSFHEYDELGRENIQYLPFVIDGNSGDFVDDASSLQAAWYTSNPYNTLTDKKIAETTIAYGEMEFDGSPLGSVVEQASPGEDWAMGSGHTQKVEYGNVRLPLTVPPTFRPIHTVHDFQSGNGGDYGAGELGYTMVQDENGHRTISYTDKQGRVILVRKVGGYQYTKLADTYNVYNDFGLLEAVIPPEAVRYMKSSGNWGYTNKTIFGGWCYYYEYDHRSRLRAKEVPGAGRTQYCYDKRDQLVLTQDANQRAKSKQTGFFTKYDKLGRPVQTGVCRVSNTWLSMEDEIASAPSTYETHTESMGNGYTNKAFPWNNYHYFLTHSFYDDYDFNNDGAADFSYNTSHGNGIGMPQDDFERIEGMLSGTRVWFDNADGDSGWLWTLSFYDDRQRMVQSHSQHHLGEWDYTSTEYDFSGKAMAINRKHRMKELDNTVSTTDITNRFRYDHAGRLRRTFQKVGNDPEVTLSEQNYNELGQLMEKNLHSNTTSGMLLTFGENFLQSIDYRYNVRGWLKTINDVDAPMGRLRRHEKILNASYQVTFNADGEFTILSYAEAKLEDTETYESKTDTRTIETNHDKAGTSFIVDVSDLEIHDRESYDLAVSVFMDRLDSQLDMAGITDRSTRRAVSNELQLMAISHFQLIMDGKTEDENDLYRQKLFYQDGYNDQLGSTAQYNGNISATVWQVQGKTRKIYGFNYDELDRLTKATFADIDANDNYNVNHAYDVPRIEYDLNGNIMKLERNRPMASYTPFTPVVTMDNLAYGYGNNSNMLLGVSDFGDDASGFTELSNNTIEYEYDENGNMTMDRNKEGLHIEYNHLNLPVHFAWDDDNDAVFDREISILYDAAGIKLRKTVIDNTNATELVRDYVGGIEYDGDRKVQSIQHAEGRLVLSESYANNGYIADGVYTENRHTYEYTIRDHLGNSRVMFSDINNNGLITVTNSSATTEMIQENHYYPFGMQHDMQSTQVGTPNDYTYNNKEINREFDLNLHDYGARWYDASIGRWHSVDPLAEKYSSYSSYNYVLNNPIIFIDPDGRSVINGAEKKRKDAKREVESMNNYVTATESKYGKKKDGFKSEKHFNHYKNMKKKLRKDKRELKKWTQESENTKERILEFKTNAPKMFNEMDNLKNEDGKVVDVYITTTDNVTNNKDGANILGFFKDGETMIPSTPDFGINTIHIELSNTPSKERTTLFVTKHEAGHASYNAGNTTSYYNFLKSNGHLKKKFYDGHGKGDPSAIRAHLYETLNDL